MKILVLDLELNQPSQSIIQVGAVVGNLKSGEILDELNVFVSLPDGEELNPKITALTGITQEILDSQGVSLLQAYRHLAEAHQRRQCLTNPMTWGGADTYLLQTQLSLSPCPPPWVFGYRHMDLKTIYQFLRLISGQGAKGGLERACRSQGLLFDGTPHDALCDARNTFRLAHAMKDSLLTPHRLKKKG